MADFVDKVLHQSVEHQEKRQNIIYAKDLPFPYNWRAKLMEGNIPSFLRWMGETDISGHAVWFMVPWRDQQKLKQLWNGMDQLLE
ncbi:hypothetical protein BGX31_001679, partial [Mortierella sp. GBA43]